MNWLINDPIVPVFASLFLALVLAAAAIPKIRNTDEFQGVVANYRLLPSFMVAPFAKLHQISKVPYGVLLDADGVILGKGLCNTREHVESLFETVREGHSTLQDFMKHSMTPVEQADQNKGVH
jgi:methylamine dehydrogenase accessory protein MauD